MRVLNPIVRATASFIPETTWTVNDSSRMFLREIDEDFQFIFGLLYSEFEENRLVDFCEGEDVTEDSRTGFPIVSSTEIAMSPDEFTGIARCIMEESVGRIPKLWIHNFGKQLAKFVEHSPDVGVAIRLSFVSIDDDTFLTKKEIEENDVRENDDDQHGDFGEGEEWKSN